MSRHLKFRKPSLAQITSMRFFERNFVFRRYRLRSGITFFPKPYEMFVGTVVLKNGMLANGEGQGADGLLTAWDATSGRIPILWTKTAAEEGIDDEEYKKFLRWYGERLRKDLWRPMWVERSREMASMKNDEIS